jgi:hypothetical protein
MRPPNFTRHAQALLAVLIAGAAACAAPPQRAEESAVARGKAPVDDRVRLAQLERDVNALVKTQGCATVGTCRSAPVGWRGCGGPRAYVVYCAATTDTMALFAKLEELKQAEMAYNQKSGLMSTCEMRLAPTVSLQGGRCKESP